MLALIFPSRFRAILLRTVECNFLSLIAQIGVVVTYSRITEVGMYFTLPGMTIVSIYTFSLVVSRASPFTTHGWSN